MERNLEIVPKSAYGAVELVEGDRLEIVHFIGGGAPDGDPLVVASLRPHAAITTIAASHGRRRT